MIWVKVNLMADIHNKQEAAQQGPAVQNAKPRMLQQNPNVVVHVVVILNLHPVAANTIRPFLFCHPV